MSHPIPSAALDDRLGFLGTSGSGKTYNAGVAVERLLSKKARVVIVDPLGVWWGLRLSADGKHASPFNVVIFGGPRGDLPLTEHAGALIGETAATMAESCILDLRELGSKSAERRFMTAFLDAIYRKATGEPFHLIVDEADLFAPQKPAGGDETLLGHMENIVRRGRVKGFIPWLISQRPAVLNKNVLSQVDGLIAFKLTSSQDRDALDSWIEGQADKAQGREIKDALPAMEVGQGVVWLPGRGVLGTAKFPQKATFDSSRTPKRGEKQKRTAALKPVDVGALKGQLAAIEEEAKANDPKKLRAEIAGLKAERAKLERQVQSAAAKAPAKPVADKDALEAAEKRGFERARNEAAKAAHALIEAAIGELDQDLSACDVALRKALADVRLAISDRSRALRGQRQALKPVYTPPPAAAAPMPRSVPTVPPRSPSSAKPATPITIPRQVEIEGVLTNPQIALLRALAWWKNMGNDQPNRRQVAAICRWKPTGSNLKDRLSELKGKGLVFYPREGFVSFTAEGAAIAPDPDMSGSVVDGIRAVLTGPQTALFDALLSFPRGPVERAALAQHLNWAPDGSNLKDRLSELKRMDLVDYPTKGLVQLQDWIVESERLAA